MLCVLRLLPMCEQVKIKNTILQARVWSQRVAKAAKVRADLIEEERQRAEVTGLSDGSECAISGIHDRPRAELYLGNPQGEHVSDSLNAIICNASKGEYLHIFRMERAMCRVPSTTAQRR